MATQVLPPQPFATANDWDIGPPRVQKSTIYDYAYMLDGRVIGTDKAGLIWAVEDHGWKVKWVWTPESPDPVSFDRVDFLLASYQKLRLRSITRAMLVWLVVIIGMVIAGIYFGWSTAQLGVIAFPLFLITEAIWARRQAKLFTQADAAAEASADRFRDWIRTKTFTGYSISLFASLFVLAIVLVMSHGVLNYPGVIVRAAGWQAELGRKTGYNSIQATLMETVWNFAALWFITRAVAATITPKAIPIVFLPAAVVGSICSLLIFPQSTVGGPFAGTLGLVGFMLTAFWLNNKTFPSRVVHQLLRGIFSVGLVVVLGDVFELQFMTPGTFLGGLFTGSLLGWLLLSKRALFRFDGLFKVVGVLCSVLLGLIALLGIMQIL